MSSKPTETDLSLVQFLKNHQPAPPPADPNLETRLLSRVHSASIVPAAMLTEPDPVSRHWIIGGLVTLSMFLGGGVTWRLQQQTAQSPPTSGAVLESFLQESWVGSVEPSVDPPFPASQPLQPVDALVPSTSPAQEWWLLIDTVGDRPQTSSAE